MEPHTNHTSTTTGSSTCLSCQGIGSRVFCPPHSTIKHGNVACHYFGANLISWYMDSQIRPGQLRHHLDLFAGNVMSGMATQRCYKPAPHKDMH